MLTIGQLAKHCGVTVRAIRHYHRIGLLAEPDRDSSGYRRYTARAAVDLIRIKVLAESGVPLARVRQLLEASPADFAAEVAGIDKAVERQIAQLEQRRRQLAGLLAGDRLVLPAEVADLLAQLQSIGVSERGVGVEREGWILLEAIAPELVTQWARSKSDALADPEFRQLYLACDQAWDLDPDDPRLEDIAVRMAEWAEGEHERATTAKQLPRPEPSGIGPVEQLMAADRSFASPAWRRLEELTQARLDPGRTATTRPGTRDVSATRRT